ncbi:MAG: YdiU family protein [Acidocella sp.]|nr:YdiU family protein [Acidocella sp.]
MADYAPVERLAPNIASFANSYVRLPAAFYASTVPTTVPEPRLIKFNDALARELGLTPPASDLAAIFAGNLIPAGAEPLAMTYAGHQFGGFVPQLGDGRAILLGEVIDAQGQRRDIQLKGAGRTPFSRRGDGRAALGPVLREYLVSEAMHALGIPTTRALAAVTTGQQILREEGMVPGAVLTRVAASHVRVGTFQYFASRGDEMSLRQLADYVINRHYPQAKAAERPYLALLQLVATAQARLIAQWLHVGFIHGVMNTDNMAISGQTIDFGPCAFMDVFDPATVYSAIDHYGRYAYANQPRIANWNLARFAETMLPLIDERQNTAVSQASQVIEGFQAQFADFWLAGARAKLGLFTAEDGDAGLMNDLLEAMHKNQADFTLTFRALNGDARSHFNDPSAFDAWAINWRARCSREPQSPSERSVKMQAANPAFIPRNHRVEQALQAAIQHADYSLFEELLLVLANPYQDQPEFARYATPPELGERVLHTFCGT